MTSSESLMSLSRGQLYFLRFLPNTSSVCLTILLQKLHLSSAVDRAELIDFVQSDLNAIHKEFMPACAPPIAYVPCQYCQKPHIKLDELRKGLNIFCKGESIDEDYYHELFHEEGTVVMYKI